MKILLIAPPASRIKGNISGVYPMPPLGLACIAAVLEENNFDVKILDMPALKIKTEDAHKFLGQYAVYGISCNIFNLSSGLELSRIIKKISPLSKVIMGGRCTAFPSKTLLRRFSSIDFMIRGEGEESMLKFCYALKENKDITSISGLSYRNGDLVIDNPTGPSLDLDKLPLPARHLLPNERYKIHPPFGIFPPATIIETSRGCNYGCVFCSLHREVKEKSVDRVIKEIREVISLRKVREIHFVDPNFTYNQDRIIELCSRMIKENIKVHWSCKTRVDLVSKRLLDAMAKAGCYMISFGLESGSQKILDSLNKKIKIQDIKDAFRLSRKANIRTLAYILLGSPQETNSTIEETVSFVGKVDPDFVLYGELLPDPSSPLINNSAQGRDSDFDKLIDFYVFKKHSLLSENNICDIAHDDIIRWLKYANSKFYLRIGYLLKRLLSLKNIQEMAVLINGFLFLLRDKVKRTYTVK